VREGELVDEFGRLMSETELVKHFGVSRITIRDAIRPLVDEGISPANEGVALSYARTAQRIGSAA
jgi:GntR family transcriptional regulator